MTRLDETKRRIAQVMVCFGKEYMALQPESVLVDVHESHVIVTLCRATSAAERACADNAGNRALLEKLSCAAFDAVKSGLETEVAAIMKRQFSAPA